jgi:hypothetical protein
MQLQLPSSPNPIPTHPPPLLHSSTVVPSLTSCSSHSLLLLPQLHPCSSPSLASSLQLIFLLLRPLLRCWVSLRLLLCLSPHHRVPPLPCVPLLHYAPLGPVAGALLPRPPPPPPPPPRRRGRRRRRRPTPPPPPPSSSSFQEHYRRSRCPSGEGEFAFAISENYVLVNST